MDTGMKNVGKKKKKRGPVVRTAATFSVDLKVKKFFQRRAERHETSLSQELEKVIIKERLDAIKRRKRGR